MSRNGNAVLVRIRIISGSLSVARVYGVSALMDAPLTASPRSIFRYTYVLDDIDGWL